jgi:hypothetical protein
MEKEKVISAIVGGVIAGFSIGVGFLLAQKTMGKWASKKGEQEKDKIADAVSQGVNQGMQQFNAMNGQQMKKRTSRFMGFDGKDNMDIPFTNSVSSPMGMNTPNSSLNVW